jgi:hypothetical protein
MIAATTHAQIPAMISATMVDFMSPVYCEHNVFEDKRRR